MERKRAKKSGEAKYPGISEAMKERSLLLRAVGRSILGLSMVGAVSACDEGDKLPVDQDADTYSGEDWTTMGVAPADWFEGPDSVDGRDGDFDAIPDGESDFEDDFGLMGVIDVPFQPDVVVQDVEDDYALGGVPRPPEDVVDEDVPPLPGEMPEPDVLDVIPDSGPGDADSEDADAEEDYFIGGIAPFPDEDIQE